MREGAQATALVATGPMAGLIGIEEAARLLRGRWGAPHPKTVRLWITHGCRPMGYTGEPIRLKAIRFGRDLCTRPEWIEEFERARLKAGEEAMKPAPPLARTRKRREADDRADRAYLKKIGAEE